MAHASAVQFAQLRRLALTREVQQMAVKFVKYGSAAYFFRTYVMGVTAVNVNLQSWPLQNTSHIVSKMTSGLAFPGLLHSVCSAQDQACFPH